MRPLLKALIVAFYFPPIGGVGVQRAVQLARHLPQFGVEPLVLTGPGHQEGQWTPDDPETMFKVVNVPVIRARGPVPTPGRMRIAVARALGRQDEFIRWWIDSIVRAGQEQAKGVDVILGELGPYETAFGVEELSRALGVPWVADLQDPWALDEMWLYPSALHRHVDLARMRSTLLDAAAVVMNAPEAAVRLRSAFPELGSRRVVTITNGFDADDFEGPVSVRDDGRFRIVHTGSLHTDLGLRHRKTRRRRELLGGMPVPGVDFLARSHVYLLQAVDFVLRDDPALRNMIEVHLVGVATSADREAAAPYSFVRFHGHKSHADAIALLRTADLLFLPMQDLPSGRRAGLVPGKTYEYMASGTPILAAIPDGDARDFLRCVGTATLCRPADVECLAEALRTRIRCWREGASTPRPDPAVIDRFESRRMTERMATLLVDVVECA